MTDRGDPLLTAWILAWDQRQIVRDPLALFDANILHPFPDTLAYSELILGPALLAAPARLFTSNPIAVQNFSLLTAFVTLAAACFLFFRWMARDAVAASAGAVLAALAPVRMGSLSHIQLLHTAAFPALLFGLWWHAAGRRRAGGLIAAASLLFLAVSSFYLAAMALLAVAVFWAVMPIAVGGRRALASVASLLPWLAAAAAAALPFALPYWRLSRDLGFVRSLEENWATWASHKDYVRPLLGSLAARLAPADALPRGRSLYLGLVVLLLAALALAAAFRRGDDERRRFGALLLGPLALCAFAFSLGGWRWLAGRRVLLPFYFAHKLPGLEGIRAPNRLGMLVDIAVIGLAVLGLATLRRWLRHRVGPAGAAAGAAIVGVLALAERTPALPLRPVETVEAGAGVPHAYRLLAQGSPAARVLELPMTTGRREREPWDVTPYRYTYFSAYHFRRIVNGTSGYLPPGHRELQERMGEFPGEGAVEAIRALPVDRLLVHKRLLPEPLPSHALPREAFRPIHECADDLLLEVVPRSFAGGARSPGFRVLPGSPRAPVRIALTWAESAPAFFYPPSRVVLTVESRDGRGSVARGATAVWAVEPRRRVFALRPPPGARTLALSVDSDGRRVGFRQWTLTSLPGGLS